MRLGPIGSLINIEISMRKLTTKVIFLFALICIPTLTSCQDAEQTRIESNKFTRLVNDAIYAKDADFILQNWNPKSQSPNKQGLEHLFAGLDPRLISSNSKLISGSSVTTGKAIKVTKKYTTSDPWGQSTATVFVTHPGRGKCCFIEGIQFDYKYNDKNALMRETTEASRLRNEFLENLKVAVSQKNTDFIREHWSPHINSISTETLQIMLSSVPVGLNKNDFESRERQTIIHAGRVIRNTQFSLEREDKTFYIDAKVSSPDEALCCQIEGFGVLTKG